MFCTKCGTQLPDDARFCSGCGAPIAPKAATPAPEPIKPIESVEPTPIQPETTTEYVPEPQPQPQPDVNETPTFENPQFNAAPDFSEFNQQPAPKKKKKAGLIIGIISAALVVLLLAAAALFLFVFREEENLAIIDAYVDSSGNAYICYENGKAVKISGDVEYAAMTPDRSKIVVAEKEGQLYWTDAKKSEKHKIADLDKDVSVGFGDDFTPLTDRFLVYELVTENEKSEFFRYEFKTGKNVAVISATVENYAQVSAVGSDAAAYGADEDVAFAVAEDGAIKLLVPDSNKFKDIASYGKNDKVELLGVSTAGELVAWTKASGGKYSVVVYRDAKEEVVFSGDATASEITHDNYEEYLAEYLSETFDSIKYESLAAYGEAIGTKWGTEMALAGEYDFEKYCIKKLTEYFKSRAEAPTFNMNVSPKGDTFVILGNKMSFYSDGGETVKVTLPEEISSSYDIYTTNSLPLYRDKNAGKAYGYYVKVKDTAATESGEPLYSLYLISFKDGERSKLVSKIRSAQLVEEYVIYTDKNDATYIAEVDFKKGELDETQRIGNEIFAVTFAEGCSDYLYYLKKTSSSEKDTYDLHVYDLSDEDSEKIASDVSASISVSTDGKKVYYFTDVSNDADSYVSYGTLKVYDVKDEESNTVSGDVVIGTLESNLQSRNIDARSIWFAKYQSGSAESYTFDVCYFDGKKSSRVIKGLEIS